MHPLLKKSWIRPCSSTDQNAFSLKLLAFQALKRRRKSNLLVIQARGRLIYSEGTEKCLISRFMEDVNKRNFVSFSDLESVC